MRFIFLSLLFLFVVACSSPELLVEEPPFFNQTLPAQEPTPLTEDISFQSKIFVDVRSSAVEDDENISSSNSVDVPSSSPSFLSMRVDPGFYYDSDLSTQEAVTQIVADAQTLGVTHLFVYAYNPTYGAYYSTTYPSTIVEGGYGQDDFLAQLITAAHAADLLVIAWLPVNNFQQVWQQHPDWREQTLSGDYLPGENYYLLSPAHSAFIAWYSGFLLDLLSRYDLDGLDAAEGVLDVHWDLAPGYDSSTLALLPADAVPGDSVWQDVRAQTLTDLHDTFCTVAHTQDVLCSVTQTWDAQPDGSLQSSSVIADYSGFDFLGIATNDHAPDLFITELLWQNEGHDVSWVADAGEAFCDQLPIDMTCVVHVEATPGDTATPTQEEFFTSLDLAADVSDGVDFYDHYQLFDFSWISD